MAKFLKNNSVVGKYLKQINKSSNESGSTEVRRVQKRIYRQATLAGLTIVLTLVMLFAMTSAWYTNVVQSSGLTFQAEAWGFKGAITVDESAILAAPGDNGILNLTVENDSDVVSAISVNISKNGVEEEMKKRLFFYADTRMSRNEEIMDRVYLNRYEGYTYNVFSNSQLTLTERFSNAPVIKWEWVYDVLGYYVLGKPYEIPSVTQTVIENADGTTTPSTVTTTTIKMDVKEYLRPIEYDYDKATTRINTEGERITIELDTVDGTTSPVEYLRLVSQTDGYPGEIDPEQAIGDYYPVEVDESGYGVYAYLCNYSEIQTATQYDTKLGELAYSYAKGEELSQEDQALLQHKVVLTLSAQQNNDTVVNVSTFDSLQEAIALGITDAVRLNSNIAIVEGQTITIPENTRVMLDLNGHTITNLDGVAIQAETGSSLTLTNGTLQQADQSGLQNPATTFGVRAVGAEVVMSQITIKDFQRGVYVSDSEEENDLDSRIHLMDCNIIAKNYAVFIAGNGLVSEQKSKLIVEKSSLSSCDIVISGNGNVSGNGRWGTDIQIVDSTIKGVRSHESNVDGAGIYQPQKDSTLTVLNSTVEGSNGIAIKGGSVKIIDSVIKGTRAHMPPAFGGSGFADTGDAVYIETNYGYDIQLHISGDKSLLTHTDSEALSVRVYEADATNVKVEVESGTFDEALPMEYLAKNSEQNQKDGKTVVTSEGVND